MRSKVRMMHKPYYQDDYCTIPKSTRSYLRKKGINIPKMKVGPKKGYKQNQKHIDKRKRFGEEHWRWDGEKTSIKNGRRRAENKFKLKPCEICGITKSERHHKDNNTSNNNENNIMFLCRKCHMKKDGRYEKFKNMAT